MSAFSFRILVLLFTLTLSCANASPSFKLDYSGGRPILVGEGSMSVVYRGTDVRTNTKVALKYFHPDNFVNLENEAIILEQLDHPRIPKYLGIHQDVTGVALVQELVVGRSLASLIKDRLTVSHHLIPHYVAQLLSIVHYIHSKGIGHLDINYGNVIITEDHALFLVDFSSAVANLQPTSGMSGRTRDYQQFLDPDARTQLDEFGMAVDYYGIGLIIQMLYRMDRPPRMANIMPGWRLTALNVLADELIKVLTNRDQAQRWRDCYENFEHLTTMDFFKDCHLDWNGIFEPLEPINPHYYPAFMKLDDAAAQFQSDSNIIETVKSESSESESSTFSESDSEDRTPPLEITKKKKKRIRCTIM